MLCFVPLIISLLSFLMITTHWGLFVAVALYGFAHGGFFTVVSPTVAEHFGLRAHGTIFGLILFFGPLWSLLIGVVSYCVLYFFTTETPSESESET